MKYDIYLFAQCTYLTKFSCSASETALIMFKKTKTPSNFSHFVIKCLQVLGPYMSPYIYNPPIYTPHYHTHTHFTFIQVIKQQLKSQYRVRYLIFNTTYLTHSHTFLKPVCVVERRAFHACAALTFYTDFQNKTFEKDHVNSLLVTDFNSFH